VARRLEIELTSARSDGTWTWRAAGALNPRGLLDASLLYEGAKVGDVVRAEAEFSLEGIAVIAVEPPRPPESPNPNVIALSGRPVAPGVTSDFAADRRPSRGRANGRPARPGEAGKVVVGEEDGARRERLRGEPPQHQKSPDDLEARRDRRTRPARPGARPNGGLHRAGGPPQRPDRLALGPKGVPTAAAHAAEGGPAPADGRPRHGHEVMPAGAATSQVRAPLGRARGAAAKDTHSAGEGPRPGPRSARQGRRLSPGNVHRNALLESLPPEHRPIAQQLMRGGIPAVRTALYFEREKARQEGRPEPSTEGVLAIAESLVNRVKAAEWHDRAEAAVRAGDELLTRDLRSLVTSSDVARDEAARELAATLREMLERRVEAARKAWASELEHLLEQAQVAQALHLSARPPDASARLPAELAVRLRDAAGEALSPELAPRRWLRLLVAVSESPVRRAVKPKGLPANLSPELLEAARQQCGRVPGLAPLLGISVPPPPGPLVVPEVLQKGPAAKRGRRRGQAGPAPAQLAGGLGRAYPGQPVEERPKAVDDKAVDDKAVDDEQSAGARQPTATELVTTELSGASSAEELAATAPARDCAPSDAVEQTTEGTAADSDEPAILSPAGGASPTAAL
jgi:hypothetical protein